MNKKDIKTSVIRAIVAIVIFAALVFVIVYQNHDRSIGNEIINLMGGSKGEDGRSIEGYAGGVALPYKGKALLVTTNTFMLMDDNGGSDVLDISVPSPAAEASGDYILVYDREGRDFSLYSGSKLVYSKRTETPIIAGRLNQNGYVLIAGEVLGGDTEITVYNSKGEPIYLWTLASGEFVDMDISPDNARMVISSVSDAEDELRGELTVVRLDSTERLASGHESDEIYFRVKINRDYTISALGSEKLDLYNSDGKRRWSLDYNGRTLLSADISNPDMMVLCCESAASGLVGTSTEIEVVNRMGEVTASTSSDGLCERLSVNGSYLAISAGKKIYIYDEKCRLQKELLADFGVKGLALFKKGNAAFVLSGSAGSIVK